MSLLDDLEIFYDGFELNPLLGVFKELELAFVKNIHKKAILKFYYIKLKSLL